MSDNTLNALRDKVFAHGWLLVGGEKMSKSKLTGIAPKDITDHFGVDAFRYYFLRAIPFGTDGSFSWEDMSARYTSELANDFGNLASRSAAMVEKYCGGVLPAKSNDAGLESALEEAATKADAAICELDSLIDFINFGVAPAVTVYIWILKDLGNIGWLLVLFHSVACCLRLARFNLGSKVVNEKWRENFFTGVPSPAGAGILLLPLIKVLSQIQQLPLVA